MPDGEVYMQMLIMDAFTGIRRGVQTNADNGCICWNDIGCVLDFVNGMVFLMEKTVQPLRNGNAHKRRRHHLSIYFIKTNVLDVLEVRKSNGVGCYTVSRV